MRLLAVVCPSGLGHYRRTVGILRRVVDRVPAVRISIACCGWQIERLKAELEPFPRWHEVVEYITHVTEPGVHWSAEPDVYDDGRLLGWEERLAGIDLGRYDVVVSDNLAGVLSHRSDAVLAGSFLWSDVLAVAYPDHPQVRAFVERERRLLAEHRPHMICVDALAMPGVSSRTRVVGCQPMCEGAAPGLPRPPGPPIRVGVLGGATTAAWAVLDTLAEELIAETDYQLALPADAVTRGQPFPRGRVVAFQFTPQSYRQCHVIIGRPGIGTLQDALAAGRPLLCVYETGQAEMSHQGRRVEELGLGLDLSARGRVDATAVRRSVNTMISEAGRTRLARARAELGVGGLDEAADWLADWLLKRGRGASAGRPTRTGNPASVSPSRVDAE